MEEEELRRCVDEVIAAVLCNSELVSTSPHLIKTLYLLAIKPCTQALCL